MLCWLSDGTLMGWILHVRWSTRHSWAEKLAFALTDLLLDGEAGQLLWCDTCWSLASQANIFHYESLLLLPPYLLTLIQNGPEAFSLWRWCANHRRETAVPKRIPHELWDAGGPLEVSTQNAPHSICGTARFLPLAASCLIAFGEDTQDSPGRALA